MRVQPTDVYGDPLGKPCSASLEEQRAAGGGRLQAAEIPARGRADFRTTPARTYLLRIRAEGHHPIGKLVDGAATEIETTLPILPAAVTGYEWPEPPPEIPGIDVAGGTAEPGAARPWLLLTDQERGALLNIWAKLWRTMIGMAPAASFVDQVAEVRADRIICRMAGGLLHALEDAPGLDPVPSGLHEPPRGYRRGPSVKTRDAYGNLQISTFISDHEPGERPRPLLADIDIDERRGAIGHLFDVAEHHLTGEKTNAVEIQQILVAHQAIDPGWRPLIG